MAYALVVSVSAGSSDGNSVTTGSVDTTGANKIILVVANSESGSGTVSDSKGNTWTQRASAASVTRFRIFESQDSPTVGSGHTFTFTGSSEFPSLAALAFSGAATTPFDQQAAANGSGTTISTGSVTPSEDNELIISGVNAFASSASITCDVGTVQETVAFAGGSCYALGVAYQIQTTATARNATWTPSGSMAFLSAAIATFKAASGGGPTGNPWYYYAILQAVT